MDLEDFGHLFTMQDRQGNLINVDFRKTSPSEVDKFTKYGGLIYFEVFIRKDYEFDGCFIKKDDVVLDIGANIGVFTAYAALKGARKIYAFEPEEKNFECLKNNVPTWVDLFPMGIMAQDGEHKFSLDENPGGHSFLNWGPTRTGEVRGVKCLSIPSFFKQEKVDKIDFMKMDVEGAEFQILKSLPGEYFQRIKTIVFELHSFMFPKERSLDLLKYLRQFYQMKIKTTIDVGGLFLIYLSKKVENA